ncbi:prostaglandin E synthase 2 [Penaeus vannamei]|uniref:Prostaglandin E synthase 2 n=1 Tax=Penaeus vannamei TaxID=6689 RepID=A0A423TUT8_PENVA|nr:prostaglandin E synthase 2 [Penaeus vannamei]
MYRDAPHLSSLIEAVSLSARPSFSLRARHPTVSLVLAPSSFSRSLQPSSLSPSSPVAASSSIPPSLTHSVHPPVHRFLSTPLSPYPFCLRRRPPSPEAGRPVGPVPVPRILSSLSGSPVCRLRLGPLSPLSSLLSSEVPASVVSPLSDLISLLSPSSLPRRPLCCFALLAQLSLRLSLSARCSLVSLQISSLSPLSGPLRPQSLIFSLSLCSRVSFRKSLLLLDLSLSSRRLSCSLSLSFPLPHSSSTLIVESLIWILSLIASLRFGHPVLSRSLRVPTSPPRGLPPSSHLSLFNLARSPLSISSLMSLSHLSHAVDKECIRIPRLRVKTTMNIYVRRVLSSLRQYEPIFSRNTPQTLQRYGVKESPLLRFASTGKTVKSPTKSNAMKRYGKLVAIGFSMGAIGGAAYMYEIYKKIVTPVSNPSEGSEYLLKEKPPTFKPARSIRTPTDTTGLKITLFQYQTCPFCCKVRAFLDYYGFNYDVIEVNSVTRAQTRWTDYRKVPFLVVELPNSDKVLQLKDSSMIVSVMQSFLDNKSENLEDLVKCYPTIEFSDDEGEKRLEIMNRYFLMYGKHPPGRSKDDIVDERKWRKWVDDVLVHVLSPNVYRTPQESFQAFQWFSKVR